MSNGKNKKQQIIALTIGGVAGLILGRFLTFSPTHLLVNLWYRFFDRPRNYFLANDVIFASVWFLLILLGAISGYLLSRGIPLRTIIGMAAGAVVGAVIGALLAPIPASILTELVWYKHFDWPIDTLLVNDAFLVAIELPLTFLGALSGYFLSRYPRPRPSGCSKGEREKM